MTTKLATAIAIVLCLATTASPAWAVAGKVAVTVTTGADQQPVAGAKIRIGDQTATTDAQGRAELTVEEGVRVLAVDHPGYVRESPSITVRGGGTTRADVTVKPVFPFNVQNPGGRLGGFLVGPFGLIQRDDLFIGKEVEKFFVNGVLATSRMNASPDAFEMKFDGGGVDGAIGLPGFKLFGWQFDPALTGVVGGAHVEIKNTANDFRNSGPGWFLGTGVELAAVPSSTPQLHLALGWQGSWLRADDLDSQIKGRDLCSVVFPTASSCRSRTDVASDTYELYARAGYSVFQNRLAPFVGVKARWSDVRLDTTIDARVGMSDVRDKLDIEFQRGRCPAVLGIAGLDFRGPDMGSLGRVFGRVQTEFNSASLSVMFKLMYAFGFVDP